MLKHGGGYEVDVIDFSTNINPVMTEERAHSLLERYSKTILKYPDIDGNKLRQKISEKEGQKSDHIVVGNGATALLYQVASTLKANTVLLIEPTFTEYRRAFESSGATVLGLTLDITLDMSSRQQQLVDQIVKVKPDVVCICTPNNPTGHTMNEDILEQIILAQKSHKAYVLIDESFRFFENKPSVFTGEHWNVIGLNSLTKYYGIPGLRIGYMATNVSLVAEVEKTMPPWSMNSIALALTADLLSDAAFHQETEKWYEAEKSFMVSELEKLKFVTPFKSSANYIFCRLAGSSGQSLNDWLLARPQKMAIRVCEDYVGLDPRYIRIGLKDHRANQLLMDALCDYEKEL